MEDVKELEAVGSNEVDSASDQAEKTESKQEHEPEQKGLMFYHTDLYDSQGKLEIHPQTGKEEQIQEQSDEQKDVPADGVDHTDLDLQKEVDELAKLYGLSEDKDSEEFHFSSQPLNQMPTKPSVPYPTKSMRSPKQNTEDNQSEQQVKDPKVQPDVPHTDAHTHREEDVKEEVKTSSCSQSKVDKQLHQESVNPADTIPEHAEVKQEFQEQLPADSSADASSNVNPTNDTESSHIDSSDQVNEDKEEAPDIFCLVCKIPIRAFEKLFGIHKEHDVKEIGAAVEDIKEEIHKNMCKLEEQITQMENFAGHLEEMYTTIEENSGRQEQNLEMHYTEVMDTLASKLEDKMQALGEEKRLKLESLFEQLVDCGKSLDTSKDLMETIQQLFKQNDKVEFVKTALDTTNRLHQYFNTDINLNISTNAEYKNITLDFSDVEQLLDSIDTLPVPSAPVINPQTPNSATTTSLRVCWSLFSDDTVEYYHLYYKPVSDVTPAENREEFMIRAKETYCTVSNLLPNTQYEFWVIAINSTGESPASESAVYVTDKEILQAGLFCPFEKTDPPAPPIIKTRECLSCENAALICWESGNINPVESYTVEIFKVTTEEQDSLATESIVGIPICESLIQLKPSETYHISVRAVNVGGPSESSRSVSIHTTGSFFYLNEETAHPLLSISDNGFTISCQEEESLEDLPYHCNKFSRCIAVLANLIPFKGKHYWEVEVDEHAEYRVGVAYEDINRSAVLGANNSSWCLRHVQTPTRHRYEFLHCGVSPDIRVSIPLRRIGILLDYDCESLSFFNMDILQHLYTFECQFRHLVHPCFALEKPGQLKIHNGIPIPQSLKLP